MTELGLSPDSQYLATGTHVGKGNIFGVKSGEKEYSLDTSGKFILSIAYSPDKKHLPSGAIDKIINIFYIELEHCCTCWKALLCPFAP